MHFAEGLYKVEEILSRSQGVENARVGLALPDTSLHRKFELAIHVILMKLEIVVFWVRQDKSVEIQSPWKV